MYPTPFCRCRCWPHVSRAICATIRAPAAAVVNACAASPGCYAVHRSQHHRNSRQRRRQSLCGHRHRRLRRIAVVVRSSSRRCHHRWLAVDFGWSRVCVFFLSVVHVLVRFVAAAEWMFQQRVVEMEGRDRESNVRN